MKSENGYKVFSNKSKENIILGGKTINKIKDYKFKLNNFEPYIPPNLEEITAKRIEQRYLDIISSGIRRMFLPTVKNTGLFQIVRELRDLILNIQVLMIKLILFIII